MATVSKPSRSALKPVAASTAPVGIEAVTPAVEKKDPDALHAAPNGAVEIQELLRQSAERGLEQTRAAFERIKTATEVTSGALAATCQATVKGMSEIGMKSIDVVKSAADAQFDFFKSLMAVKSPSEALALHKDFLTQQFEALKGQTEDLASTTQRIAREAVEPLKSNFGKSFNVTA